jgi:hypothetical protein
MLFTAQISVEDAVSKRSSEVDNVQDVARLPPRKHLGSVFFSMVFYYKSVKPDL